MGCKSSKAAQAPAHTAANASVDDCPALAPAKDEHANTVTAEEASTAASTEVEVSTDAPVDAVKMPETMVEEAEPAAVGQHHVGERAAPEEAAVVEPKDAELKVVFEPGPVDIAANWETGLVKDVSEGGQAYRLGARAGIRFLTVAGKPYTKDRLLAARAGTENYEVTFAPVGPHITKVLYENYEALRMKVRDDLKQGESDGRLDGALEQVETQRKQASQEKEEQVIVPEIVIEDGPAPVKCGLFC